MDCANGFKKYVLIWFKMCFHTLMCRCGYIYLNWDIDSHYVQILELRTEFLDYSYLFDHECNLLLNSKFPLSLNFITLCIYKPIILIAFAFNKSFTELQ